MLSTKDAGNNQNDWFSFAYFFVRKGRLVYFGEGRIEIEYAFDDELKAFVELAESRKEEIACMQWAV